VAVNLGALHELLVRKAEEVAGFSRRLLVPIEGVAVRVSMELGGCALGSLGAGGGKLKEGGERHRAGRVQAAPRTLAPEVADRGEAGGPFGTLALAI